MTESAGVRHGGCLCGAVRYELHGEPMIVHACHCTRCQRRTGSAFAVNIWTESDNVVLRSGRPEKRSAPGVEAGKPSDTWFCPDCGTALWSRFGTAPANSRFVRAGTLDDPSAYTPDVHIHTSSRQPWVVIPEGAAAFDEFYSIKEIWPEAKRKRLRALISGLGEQQ